MLAVQFLEASRRKKKKTKRVHLFFVHEQLCKHAPVTTRTRNEASPNLGLVEVLCLLFVDVFLARVFSVFPLVNIGI